MFSVKIKKLSPEATIPTRASDGAACFDIRALKVRYDSNGDVYITTGLSFEIPKGMAMMVYSRSGHGFNSGIKLSNCVGVIDSDYRGELMVKLTTDNRRGQEVLDQIKKGDRVAQFMIINVPLVSLDEVESLSETQRGAGGFGSTGK